MKKIKLITLLSILVLGLVSFTNFTESSKYKCMIQMTNYTGEGAYIVISLLNPEGEYVETLNVKGDDDEWYNTVESWWQFYGKRRPNIDAITGATISGGERAISVIEIDNDKIDKGYKLRFETAVEDQEYYESDVELELTSASVKSKVEGKGFIRYIRLMAQ
ncbi:DUF2271 domain-containing protein [Winogradskyella eckloniae]|uniref:DUF2271 domain-containing protein n=1 Tax=Winogradskyella eckloniae TaxID=1089306 RepID=UPI0015657DEE|nr:DUF2271 domain-containing protein [Winogradskyella eckloniae]NRD20437.1 DUF2271 domain-containing protein [Winogradskyella eckloniae]